MTLRSASIRVTVACCVVLGASLLLFGAALKNDFVNWDDQVYVLENPHLAVSSFNDVLWFFTNGYYRSYIPLTMLSHSVDYALWQFAPSGHHLTSILLHAANSGWFFLLSIVLLRAVSRPIRVGGPDPVAASWTHAGTPEILGGTVAALIFAVHPMRVESAAWVSDRKDLLACFFLLPMLIVYLRYTSLRGDPRGRRWYLLALLLYLLALLSKSSVLVAPGALILLDFFFIESAPARMSLGSLIREKIPFLVLSVAAAAAAFNAVPDKEMSYMISGLSLTQKLLLPFYSISFYLGKLLWPAHLAPVYDFPPASTMAAAAVIAVLVSGLCVLLYRLGTRYALAAWIAYLLFLAPTLAFPLSGIQPIADRYVYTAAPALFLLVGGVIGRMYHLPVMRETMLIRILLSVGAALVIAMLALRSSRQIGYWENSETLWQHEVDVYPQIALGYNNLGVAVSNSGRPDEAIMQFTVALGLKPDYAHAWNNLGRAQYAKGDIHAAIASHLRAIALDSEYVDAYVNLGEVFVRAADPGRATVLLQRAVTLDPSSPRAWYTLGWATFEKGDSISALPLFEKALALQPGQARASYYEGLILSRRGDAQGALAAFRNAARHGDADAQAVLRSQGMPW